MQRSTAEKIFLCLFLPAVVVVYLIKAYPAALLAPLGIEDPYGTFFYVLGKSPNFWYQTAYSGIVCGIALWLLLRGRTPYGNKRDRQGLSAYQKKKFLSIFLVQLVGFYLIPFVMPMIGTGEWADLAKKNDFAVAAGQTRFELAEPLSYNNDKPHQELVVYLNDTLLPVTVYEIEDRRNKADWTLATAIILAEPAAADGTLTVSTFHRLHKLAHVYLSPAFFSTIPFLYMFVAIPIFVWLFGKRYCSWVCACGNLAETIGTTPWGSKWVRNGTPRGEKSIWLEWIQVVMLIFSVVVGVSAILNVYHVINPTTYHRLWYLQDFITDFTFGSIIGVGLYPFLGTRIWCRYGCPMARWMKIFGRFGRSKFQVVPDEQCIGIGDCTKACPMGIPVDEFAHRDKKPIEVAFGLEQTSCIGCGGCVDSCPVSALSFKTVNGRAVLASDRDPLATGTGAQQTGGRSGSD